jgi:hypothetical protein
MITNSFSTDIKYIFNKLKNREHFAFSKYADGEYKVLVNEAIINCDNWIFNPTLHTIEHHYLLDSYLYADDDYFVGISCPCCQPTNHIKWMRENVKTKNVTWANLFVNSNYEFFKNNFFKEFDNWNGLVTLVANEAGIKNTLPFKVNNYIPIRIGSWFNPELEYIIGMMKDQAEKSNNQLFLFSAGPMGNILAHQLYMVNKKNTYIDIGSTINPWIVGNNRGYLNGINEKVCIW